MSISLQYTNKYTMMSEELKLNHPWSIYLKEPLSSYTRYSTYYKELHKLLVFTERIALDIENLREDQVTLTVYTIGTPMECALHKGDCSMDYSFQWQQLFPKYIYDFIKHYSKFDIDINVNIIIISPDDIFMDDCYNEPLFTTQCDEYKFEKVKNREYIHSGTNLTIKVDIFTCPVPQLETRLDTIKQQNSFIEKYMPDYELEDFTPTDNDIKFINDFYRLLEVIMSNKKSNMIINSYATFKNARGYGTYALFPSLLELANKHKIIATEWNFQENNFKSRLVSKINYTVNYINYSVSYVEPCYTYIIEDYKKVSTEYLKKRPTNVCILIKFPYYKMVYRQF